MAALDERGATLDLSELCAACREELSAPSPASAGPSGGALPPYYLFPSGNAFHGACLCQQGAALAVPQQRSRIEYLQQTLAAAVRPGTATCVGFVRARVSTSVTENSTACLLTCLIALSLAQLLLWKCVHHY